MKTQEKTTTNAFVNLYDSLETTKIALRQEADYIRREADYIEKTQKEVKRFGNGHFRPSIEVRTTSRKKSVKSKSAKPNRRSPEDLKTMMGQVLSWVGSNQGTTSTKIGAGLKISPADLALPIRKLVQSKKLKKKGERSHTQYFTKGTQITK